MSSKPDDPRLGQLVDLIVVLASGELSARLEPSQARDSIDAVTVGINLLAGELQQMYSVLESRVTERTIELEALKEQLERQALTDALTGLPNRLVLGDRLGQAIRRAEGGPLPPAVLMLDLDEFKYVNDSLGHGVGDEVLRTVARRLQSSVRKTDTVSRLGGDEFAVVVHEATESMTLTIARRILKLLAEPMTVENHRLSMGASIGVRFGARGQTADHLIRDADTALYEAKSRGKGMLAIFEPSMHTASQHRMRILTDLRERIVRDGLTLAFQPIVTLPGRRIVGAEALLRWQHPTLGEIPRAQFIAIAEQSGTMPELGHWVLREAMQTLSRWLPTLPPATPFSLHINVSPTELRSGNWADGLFELAAEHDVPAARLVIELSETSSVAGDVTIVEQLHKIRAAGFGVQIDDFGTGYSSVAYLRQLPLDGVKIDQSLAALVDGTDADREFFAAVLKLVGAAGLSAVVEGVETAAQAEHLITLGAEFAQGYHFGMPAPADDLFDLVRSQWPSRI